MFIQPENKVARTNILIGEKDYRGRRVLQEVGNRMLEFMFETLGMEKVKADFIGRSNASTFMTKGLGFTCEGVLKEEILGFSGDRMDIYLFGLLRKEWRAAQKTATDFDKQ